MGFNGDLYPTAGASVVMTTKGDMVDYNTERQRLGIGATGQVLTVAGALPTWATLTTADSVLTTQGDVLYESGSGLARLGFGTSGDVLTTKGTGANPVWETPSTSTTLTKVTKDFNDIAAGSLTIYALPQDEALVNIFTDITTAFDGTTTGVSVGDPSDPNGFSESATWQATGLTNATRGAFVSGFKGMRSTSGSTNIIASSADVAVEAGATADSNTTAGEATYKQITGCTVGAAINEMTWDIYNTASMNFKWALYDDDSNTPNNMLGNEVEATMGAVTNTYTTVTQATSGSPVVPSDGKVWIGIQAYNNTSYSLRATGGSASYSSSIYDSGQVYSAGFPDPATATSVGSNDVRAGIMEAGTFGTVTQGEADFYLQIAST